MALDDTATGILVNRPEDLARTIHAHPTMSEAVKEAALAVSKRALHAL